MAEQARKAVVDTDDQQRADAEAQDAAREAARAPKRPEPREGGAYLVNDVLVDAEGKPIKSEKKDDG
jgi:hypothetical protein